MKNQLNLQEVLKTNENVLSLMKERNLKIRQVNGQKIVNGPPADWNGPPPDPGCEIFVGKLPRDIQEDVLYNIFAQIGQIYEMRLMMDFSGHTRGFCFIQYSTIEEARRAIHYLNNFEIVPGRRIGVVRSTNNCRLCITHLPPDLPSEAIIRKIFSITDEVESVAVYRTQRGKARFVLMNYKSHRGAAMARRKLVPERATLFANTPITVDWAHPSMQPCNAIEDIGSLDEEGAVVIRTSVIGGEGKPSPISKVRKEALDRNIKIYVQDDMSQSTKQINKVISAPKRSNSSNQFNQIYPRALDLGKTTQSFNLFDEFTFSSPPQENPESVGLSDHLRMGIQNGFQKENFRDEITPRFSNLSLLSEEEKNFVTIQNQSKILGPKECFFPLAQDKGIHGPYGKVVGPLTPMNSVGYQTVVCPEKGFPIQQVPGNMIPNGFPHIYTPMPGICVIPQQTLLDSWQIDNRAYYGYNQHHSMPTSCAACLEELMHSTLSRMPEPCNLNGNVRISEIPPQEYESRKERDCSCSEQSYQNQADFKIRRQKPKPLYEKQKTVRQFPGIKANSRRRNNSGNRENVEEQIFVSKTSQSGMVPKGARPILSSKK